MSDGKKFAAKSLESAEERLSEIERKYSVIQERIQSYDQVLIEFVDVKKMLKQIKQNSSELTSSVETNTKQSSDAILKIASQVGSLKAILDFNSNAIRDQNSSREESQSKTATYLRDLTASYSHLLSKFNELAEDHQL